MEGCHMTQQFQLLSIYIYIPKKTENNGSLENLYMNVLSSIIH